MQTEEQPNMAVARNIVSALPDAAILLDNALRLTRFNAQYVRLSGKSAREVGRTSRSRHSAFKFVAHDRVKDLNNARQCLRTHQTIHLVDVSVRNAAHESFVMMQTFVPILNEADLPAGVVVIFRDTSAEARVHLRYKELLERERVRAEELERQVTDKVRQFTEAMKIIKRLVLKGDSKTLRKALEASHD